jgi:monofunctional biosynthetic peptidoglycan transglycosylase
MYARISETAALWMAWLRDVAKPVRIAGKLARVLIGLVIICHAVLIVVILFASLALLRINPSFTALMVYRGVTVHQKSRPIHFVPLRQIPRVARNMVVRLEDYRFYRHGGVDLGAIRDAWRINTAIGRTAVGGSTIPMQLARNLFLTPRKTYLRKYLEAIIAVEMDLILPKDRILELYLNCIEWGKGVFGIGAASSYYYQSGVGNLGLDEIRRLVTIITNPLRYNVHTYYKSHQMAERYAYLLSRFPDSSAEPIEMGPIAPVPDAPEAESPASPPPHVAPVFPPGSTAIRTPAAGIQPGANPAQQPLSISTR